MPAAFDLRIAWNRIRSRVALRSVKETHRHFSLRARYDVERNAVMWILAEVRVQISGKGGDIPIRSRVERIVGNVGVPPIVCRKDSATANHWNGRRDASVAVSRERLQPRRHVRPSARSENRSGEDRCQDAPHGKPSLPALFPTPSTWPSSRRGAPKSRGEEALYVHRARDRGGPQRRVVCNVPSHRFSALRNLYSHRSAPGPGPPPRWRRRHGSAELVAGVASPAAGWKYNQARRKRPRTARLVRQYLR